MAFLVSPIPSLPYQPRSSRCCARSPSAPIQTSLLPITTIQSLAGLSSGAFENVPPPSSGTTSLLVSLPFTSVEKARNYLHTWVRSYAFSSSALLQHPISTSSDIHNSYIHFYTRSTKRGCLTISAEPGPVGTLIRVTSSSRFTNPTGAFTTSLPGERRILRDLFSELNSDFKGVSVLYKPSNLRLRRPQSTIQAEVTMFVGEVRTVKSHVVESFLQQWVVDTTLSASGGPFVARLPPLSSEPLDHGVRIRAGKKGECTINATVKGKGRNSKKVIVAVSATQPRDPGTIAVLRRYVYAFRLYFFQSETNVRKGCHQICCGAFRNLESIPEKTGGDRLNNVAKSLSLLVWKSAVNAWIADYQMTLSVT